MNRLKAKILKFGSGAIEQGFISLLNFGMIILLSWLLSTEEFAKFIILFSSISLIYSISIGLWSNPVLVFLQHKYGETKKQYLFIIIFYNTITSFLLSMVVNFIIVSFIRDISIFEMLGVALVSWSWSQYEIIRKANYANHKINITLLASFLLIIVFFLGNIISYNYWEFDSLYVLGILFSGYLLSTLIAVKSYLAEQNTDIIDLKKLKKKIVSDHWSYAKWPIAGMIGFWVYTQGYFIIADLFLNDLELGGLRAAMNLLGTVTILLTLFENFLTSSTTQIFKEQGVVKLYNYINGLYKKLLIPYIAIVSIIGILSYTLFDIIYRNQYHDFKFLIVVFTIYQIILGLNRPATIGLRVQIKNKSFFWGHLFAALYSISIGIVLVSYFDILGAALSIMISGLIFTSIILLVSEMNKRKIHI